MATSVPTATTFAPPLSPVIATDFTASDTLLTMGDLILRNPIQSTGIFFMIIVASTGLEYLFELLDNQRNAYLRNIILSTKEELAAVAFSQMLLIFLSMIAGFSDTAKSVTLLATLMIVYMCLNFSLYVVIVNILQSRRALEWNSFEWARLELDALHSKQEALFKAARQVFLRRASVGPKVVAALQDNKEGPTSIMPVLFASYLGHVERGFLKESFDFTWVTWSALIGIVIVDGLRSITVNSMTTVNIPVTQVLTFVFIVGWGLLGALKLVQYLQHKSLMKYIYQWNLNSRFAEVTGNSNNNNSASRGAGGRSAAEQRMLEDQDDAGEKRVKNDDEMAEELVKNFYFNSVGGSLSVLHVFMLSILWFTCVFCVGMIHFSWVHMGPVALLVYVAAAVPFVAAVTTILPAAFTDIFIAASISSNFDDDLITKSVNGQFDLRQVDEEDDDSDNDEDTQNDNLLSQLTGGGEDGREGEDVPTAASKKKFLSDRRGNKNHHRHLDGADEAEFDDEIDAPLDEVALGLGSTGAAPIRVQGVPPSAATLEKSRQEQREAALRSGGGKSGQFMWAPKRPIFYAPMGNPGQL